nr:TonB-dependent receptor [Salinimonas lutimaris]
MVCISSQVWADEPLSDIEKIRINGQQRAQPGAYISASQGWVDGQELTDRPMLRTGEMLEFIPGMMVTQHSGSGKANQYFLRGFNLDHGTDFAVHVDGMPVNMRSHGHGQGYSDLNFVIPETVASLNYFKGTYYAAIGDFSGAGGAQFALKNELSRNQVSATLGEDNYQRYLVLNQLDVGQGKLLGAGEFQVYDGPWTDISEDIDKKNALLRYVSGLAGGELSVTAMAYDNQWNSADQIPSRAVGQGLIDQLGSLDTTVGGESSRYSLSAQFTDDAWQASGYIIDTELTLFSNFTYFLENPELGDQFEQRDDRVIYGSDVSYTYAMAGSDNTITSGFQWRYDDIDEVGLYPTVNRQRTGVTRQDAISSASYAGYIQANLFVTDKLNLTLGGRYDYIDVDVDSVLPANSGTDTDSMFNLKGALKYQLTDTATMFVNYGQGFHSNDARGAVIQVDPVTGEDATTAPLLVRSEGMETGINWTDNQRFNVSAALWHLSLDSELVYVGDAGFTEPSRPSSRTGVEASAYYWLGHHWNLDAEAAWTNARFDDNVEGEGDYIDGTVPVVVSAGVSWFEHSDRQGVSATLRVRYLSSRIVESTDTVSAPSTFLLNAQLGYQAADWQVALEVLNLLDRDAHDIDYFYASRLPGEPAQGVEDLHYHPVEPRTARVTVSYFY